ncbi:MAG: hypothetical protein HYU27_01325 [Acidobacteria bacterium]|nr:hypothetical protein [Acidobacteriota bacterium]
MADFSQVGKAIVSAAGALLLLTISMRGNEDGVFQVSTECLACHNSLMTPSGEDVSIGADWRGTMMANSSRDPYWQAGVRRETMDHPSASKEIEDECTICHMPMSTTMARASGRKGKMFDYLPIGKRTTEDGQLAADGVSCTLCHQVTSQKFGTPESFTGGYVVDAKLPAPRPIFGRFEVSPGHTTVMRSATGFKPTESRHIEQSELCATCHTLYTKALGPRGQVLGRLPEQVPYLEWRHSAFREEKSCQACHMPAVLEETPITNVLGQPRKGFPKHVFRGGNFLMLRMLNRYRADLGVTATPHEIDASVRRTVEHLQSETASVSIAHSVLAYGKLDIDVDVHNLAGHKFPTAYPSRRAWLHLTVKDQTGRTVFESGAVTTKGQIAGNDNDADAARYEPHYTEVRNADEVQIYESIMVDSNGTVTTGLLNALRFIKDNRLLPRGFDKTSAEPDIAVVGDAAKDGDFIEGRDRVRYSVDVGAAGGPFQIEVELRFQPISFRWADNLRKYDAPEPKRFVSYYDAMSAASSEMISRTTLTVR